MAADLAADLDGRLYEQYYSGQEVSDHLAPYSVVRYYYNTTPSRVLVVETTHHAHLPWRVLGWSCMEMATVTLRFFKSSWPKNPYWGKQRDPDDPLGTLRCVEL